MPRREPAPGLPRSGRGARRGIRLALCASAWLAASLGCAGPGRHDRLAISAGASGLPELGWVVGLSQRFHQSDAVRYDLELDFTHQALDEEHGGPDPSGDEWDQVRAGLKLTLPPGPGHRWVARAGGVWLRAQGDPGSLDAPGDYGGFYAGLGFELDLGSSFSTGPDFSLLVVDAEGTEGFDVAPQLAWRLVWHL